MDKYFQPVAKYIDNTDGSGETRQVIRRGPSFARRPSRGATGTQRRQITCSRFFRPVCIVFISPPGVELFVLSLCFACTVRCLCFLISTLPASMFCSIRVTLSHAYSSDFTPVGYGGTGGKYGIILPVSSRSVPQR